MNTIWSDYVQNIGTLYHSRILRFSDVYKQEYMNAFQINPRSRILEIGCGPGAFTQSLARWYPQSEVIGVDKDSSFINYAIQKAPHIKFLEADITALPFEDHSFDVVISNTVQEHIEPSEFFKEQHRILKPGGICLVLTTRKEFTKEPEWITQLSESEKDIWKKVEHRYLDILPKYNIGKYYASEQELPITMSRYDFSNISTNYLTIHLTPDNPDVSKESAYEMINAHRQADLDTVNSLRRIASDLISETELIQLQDCVNKRYDQRITLYDQGKKQWDVTLSLTMILRGIKTSQDFVAFVSKGLAE